MEYIELKKIVCYASHGVTEQERTTGNTYIIDIKLFLDLKKAIESDLLEDTVNYADIIDIIKREMTTPSRLIEHAAGRIVRRIKLACPQVSNIDIRLAKMYPPVNGEIQEAAVVIRE